MRFCDRIRIRREELGLSQDDLAKRMGYKSRSTINKIELGINDVSQSKIIILAKALETTVGYLMGDEENSHSKNVTIKQEPPILSKFNQLNKDGKIKADSYIDGLLENPSYTLLKNEKYEYVAYTETDSINDIDEDDDEIKHT